MAQEKIPAKSRRVEPHPLVLELFEALKTRGYSPEGGQSLLCGLRANRIRIWKQGYVSPRGPSLRLLADALKNVKSLPIIQRDIFGDRDLYRLLKPHITFEEKEALLDSTDYESYRRSLRQLAKAYGLLDPKPEKGEET